MQSIWVNRPIVVPWPQCGCCWSTKTAPEPVMELFVLMAEDMAQLAHSFALGYGRADGETRPCCHFSSGT